MDDLVRIYSTLSEADAIMKSDRLELEGIKAVMMNKKDSAYGIGMWGEIELYVEPGDAEKARAILKAKHE